MVLATLTAVAFGSGCMLSPENGDWYDSIFHDVTFTVSSTWPDAPYVIETAQLDLDDNVVGWHFLTAGTVDTYLLTDLDGRDLYIDTVKTSILIGWKPAGGPGCGNVPCNYKVRVRARVKTPDGTWLPAYTFDDGTASCRSSELVAGGSDRVITQCARDDQWVEIYALGS